MSDLKAEVEAQAEFDPETMVVNSEGMVIFAELRLHGPEQEGDHVWFGVLPGPGSSDDEVNGNFTLEEMKALRQKIDTAIEIWEEAL